MILVFLLEMFLFKIDEFQNVPYNDVPSQSASNTVEDLPSSSEVSLADYDDKSDASKIIAGSKVS